MDPFTQRMLERARARREKLDSQLSNAGHEIKRRSPLKDANIILAQAPVIASKITSASPVKNSVHQSPKSSPIKTNKHNSPSKKTSDITEKKNKENGENSSTSVKSKLQRLGKLYSDDSQRELSSPIHRTEEKFAAEDRSNEQKPVKSSARLNRLAALATTINNWEDDLSHPTLTKTTVSKAEKIQAKLNEQVRNVSESQPSTSGYNKKTCNNNGGPVKQLKWDKSVLDTLEAQGFSRTKSNSRLVYEYKDCSKESNETLQKSSTNNQSTSVSENVREEIPESKKSSEGPASLSLNSSCQSIKSPEKVVTPASSGVNNTRIGSRYGYNGSPKNSIIQSPGSVLSKASMFESKNSQPKIRDPAEMSLSERKALFEKNNTGEPLIPKAPLTMSIPTKMLMSKEKMTNQSADSNVNNRSTNNITSKSVGVQRAMFEQGTPVQELENNILQSVHNERQRELDMLRSRFNRNKEVAQAAAGSYIRTSESSEGKSNSPKNSPICPVKPTPVSDHVPLPPPMPKSESISQHNNVRNSSSKRVVGSPLKSQYQALVDIKRIRVSPPKPGNLYPDLTGIEVSTTDTDSDYNVGTTEAETATLETTETENESLTEAEYCIQDENEFDASEESDIGNTSLGRSILSAVKQQTAFNKKRSIEPDPDSTTSDISVLDEMDEYLDECLANQEAQEVVRMEGPTPAKLNKGVKSPSASSSSFKYTHGNYIHHSPVKITPTSSPHNDEPYITEGDKSVPLMHSVSFYRRQQSQTPKTPARLITRIPIESESCSSGDDESTLVQGKVKSLLEEVCKQETVIGQASQALNLCNSTVEFSGSREQVEGERLLLLATHRRQAALQEVQRLRVEGTLRPVVPGSSEVQESGSMTISAITLPLKRDFFIHKEADSCLHFVCLVRHLDTVIATPVVQAEIGDSCLRFPSTLKLQDLYSDFTVTIEVYFLETRAEILPHEIKYHIHNSGNNANISGSGKKISGKTPKKLLKHENRLVMPSVQSPAGPSAVRSPAFSLSGYVVFSLTEVQRQQFTLNKVPKSSPLEGRLQMHIECELSVSVEHRGFLTMFEDISGFGAWHRRWCLLKGATLSYWKYPDDERKKPPIGSLNLQDVMTTNVNIVSRDICARPHTFLLETVRPALPDDAENLVLVRKGSQTIIRHLISADTKEDRLEWCAKLNKTLHLIRAWGGSATS